MTNIFWDYDAMGDLSESDQMEIFNTEFNNPFHDPVSVFFVNKINSNYKRVVLWKDDYDLITYHIFERSKLVSDGQFMGMGGLSELRLRVENEQGDPSVKAKHMESFLFMFQAVITIQMLNMGWVKRKSEKDTSKRIRKKITKSAKYKGDTYFLSRLDQAERSSTFFGVSGIKQRYHSRRGHSRTLKSGKKIWIKSCWAGDKKLGTVSKDYKYE